jgi:hypothetical protein
MKNGKIQNGVPIKTFGNDGMWARRRYRHSRAR